MTQFSFLCSLILLYYFIRLGDAGVIFRLTKLENGEYRVLKTETENKTLFAVSPDPNEIAKAYYEQLINKTGWAFLEIHTNESYSNSDQAWAVGYLEGYATSDLIYMSWYNTIKGFCDGREDFCVKLYWYLKENMEWMENNIKKMDDGDEYWHHISLIWKQMNGMVDGYERANNDPEKNLTATDFFLLNLQGDVEDLSEALKAEENNFNTTDYMPLLAKGLGHCSALIKVLPDGSDIFVSQVTWNTYQSMLRIQKKYVLPLRRIPKSDQLVPGVAMSFSSYPGVITSGDDFYLISSGLVALETTIGNGNASLWKYVQPKNSIYEFARSMVANRLARDGQLWTMIFSKFNSGTYNNQWMVLDYNKFMKSRGVAPADLPNGLLWVLEQIPKYIHADDVTYILRQKAYWASYNVAFFTDIFTLSGNQAMVEKFGDWFTYAKNPRARIFQRDQDKIRDIENMLDLMRYNDFMNDPLSKCDCNPPYSAENAIAARCDLNPANGIYPFPALGHRQHGATDAKITSAPMFGNSLQFLAVSGPTYNESRGIPPFQWSTSDYEQTTPHLGHPDKWTFEAGVYQWL